MESNSYKDRDINPYNGHWYEEEDEQGRVCYVDGTQKTYDVPRDYEDWASRELEAYLKTTTWRRVKDEKKNKFYFYDKTTKETSWHAPQIVKSFQLFLRDLNKLLKTTEWRRTKDEVKTNKYYFHNRGTKKTAWDMPKPWEKLKTPEDAEPVIVESTSNTSTSQEFYPEAAVEASDSNAMEVNHGAVQDNPEETKPVDGLATTSVEQSSLAAIETEIEAENFDEYYDEDNELDLVQQEDVPRDYQSSYEQYGFDASRKSTGASEELEDSNAMDTDDFSQDDIMRAEEEIELRDCIMDLNIERTVKTLVWCGTNIVEIVPKLKDNYTGYAQMALITLELLAFATQLSTKASKSEEPCVEGRTRMRLPQPTGGGIDTESVAVEHLADLIKQRFSREAYALKDAVWLDDMIADPLLRRTLVELYGQHRGSELLERCLLKISSEGYHMEIAQVIREVDYFDVYSNLLVHMLPTIAQASGEDLAALSADLKRMCCHSEYMFAYAIASLLHLESRLGGEQRNFERQYQQASQQEYDRMEEGTSRKGTGEAEKREGEGEGEEESKPQSASGFNSAVADWRRKVRRLRQDLEEAAIWGRRDDGSRQAQAATLALRLVGTYSQAFAEYSSTSSYSSASSSSLSSSSSSSFSSSSTSSISGGSGKAGPDPVLRAFLHFAAMLKEKRVKPAQIIEVCAVYLGVEKVEDIDVTEVSADTLQQCAKGLRMPCAFALLRQPQVLEALVGSFVSLKGTTGGTGLASSLGKSVAGGGAGAGGAGAPSSSSSGRGTAKILAMATACACDDVASTRSSRGYSGALSASPLVGEHDFEASAAEVRAVEEQLLRAQALCIELHKRADFILEWDQVEELVGLMDRPVVSMCVLRWIRDLVEDSAFTATAGFVALSPALLQLVATAQELYPLQRPDCFDILKSVLSLSAVKDAEESFTVVPAQKDALECIVHLMGLGFVSVPMEFLDDAVNTFDGAMVRHLLMCLLHAMEPPYSGAFVQQVLDLITLKPNVLQAIQSNFSEGLLKLLSFADHLLQSFESSSPPSSSGITAATVRRAEQLHTHISQIIDASW